MFELTRSPYYNEVIKNIETVKNDDFSRPSVNELRESIKFMSDFNKNLQKIYEEQKLIQPQVDIISKENIDIDKNFKFLDDVLLHMENSIRDKDINSLITNMLKGKELVEYLFKSFDVIAEIERREPLYSPVPVVNEIIRVAKGVMNNKFKEEPLKNIIEGFMAKVKETREEFIVMKKLESPSELDEEIQKVEEGYNGLIDGLSEMMKFFDNNDYSCLNMGMEKIKINSERLLESQKILEKPCEEPAKKTCFRCGTDNTIKAKFCIKCKMEIPEFKSQDSPLNVDITLEDQEFTGERNIPMTENVYKLSLAVENFQSGKISKEKLISTVSWLEKKIISSRKQFEGQKKKKPQNIPEKERSLMEEMENLTEKGIGNFEKAIKNFKDFFKNNDELLLKEGLEKAIEGGGYLYRVQARFQLLSQQ